MYGINYLNCIFSTKLYFFQIVEKLEKSFLAAELNQSMMKVPKNKEEDSNGQTEFLHVFGTEVLPVPLDNDVKVWTEKQIKNKLMKKGTAIMKQLGQDIAGDQIIN